MKKAIKNKKKYVKAWQLGGNSDMEKKLIADGAIRCLPDGSYELFSQEAVNGSGEIAWPGDYFKVDEKEGASYPYPNERSFFEANHTQVGENLYEQRNFPLLIWERKDAMSEEMEYLLRTHRLELREEDPLHYFNAVLWGAKLSAPADAVLVLYEVKREADGGIADIRFNFVAREEFESNYSRCERL